jgi:hypothetical protein
LRELEHKSNRLNAAGTDAAARAPNAPPRRGASRAGIRSLHLGAIVLWPNIESISSLRKYHSQTAWNLLRMHN